MTDHPLPALHDAFADLADPRVDRTKEHQVLDSVASAICAVICGAESWVASEAVGHTKHAWLRTFLALRGGIPSHDTFGRVFAALDAAQLQQGLLRWVRAVWPARAGAVIAVDGHTVRGSYDRGIGTAAIQLVSAWAGQARLVLAHRKVDDTATASTAIPELLQVLDLAGCPVTVDALGCQTAMAKHVVQQGATDVLAVQDHQEQFYHDIVDPVRSAHAEQWRGVAPRHDRTVTGDHGRSATRADWVIHDPDLLT